MIVDPDLERQTVVATFLSQYGDVHCCEGLDASRRCDAVGLVAAAVLPDGDGRALLHGTRLGVLIVDEPWPPNVCLPPSVFAWKGQHLGDLVPFAREVVRRSRLRQIVAICAADWGLSQLEQELVETCVRDGLDRELNAHALRLSLSGYKKRIERTLQKAGVDDMATLVLRILWTAAKPPVDLRTTRTR